MDRWRKWGWLGAAIGLVALAAVWLWLVPSWQRSPAEDSVAATATSDESQYTQARLAMVSEQIEARGIRDERVLQAMRTVPRHEFVLDNYVSRAYDDQPLVIGYGQTISQPHVVAFMTELLQVSPDDRVLEIGTGSGYQAAILAELTPHVVSIEIVPELCEQARQRLGDAVKVICADGYDGYEDDAPYDGIMVTCAPDHIPQPLVNQLADGGRMVIPVGPPGMYQTLWLVQRQGEAIITEQIADVVFVPLVREAR